MVKTVARALQRRQNRRTSDEPNPTYRCRPRRARALRAAAQASGVGQEAAPVPDDSHCLTKRPSGPGPEIAAKPPFCHTTVAPASAWGVGPARHGPDIGDAGEVRVLCTSPRGPQGKGAGGFGSSGAGVISDRPSHSSCDGSRWNSAQLGPAMVENCRQHAECAAVCRDAVRLRQKAGWVSRSCRWPVQATPRARSVGSAPGSGPLIQSPTTPPTTTGGSLPARKAWARKFMAWPRKTVEAGKGAAGAPLLPVLPSAPSF